MKRQSRWLMFRYPLVLLSIAYCLHYWGADDAAWFWIGFIAIIWGVASLLNKIAIFAVLIIERPSGSWSKTDNTDIVYPLALLIASYFISQWGISKNLWVPMSDIAYLWGGALLIRKLFLFLIEPPPPAPVEQNKTE